MAFATAVTLAAQQRTFTNPKPEGHFTTVMPAAVAFSAFGGTPLHWKGYAVDPKVNPSAEAIGYIFWTTDLAPKEFAYHGPIHILVGLDTKGIITGAVVDYHAEPYGHFSVEPAAFAAQFKGKSIFDPFVVGRDVDAVSRASISINSGTRAVRDSVRAAARAFLSPDLVTRPGGRARP
jgi:transcriptional regulator of nitric oxide reductase